MYLSGTTTRTHQEVNPIHVGVILEDFRCGGGELMLQLMTRPKAMLQLRDMHTTSHVQLRDGKKGLRHIRWLVVHIGQLSQDLQHLISYADSFT